MSILNPNINNCSYIFKPAYTVESLSPLSYTKIPLIILPNRIFSKLPSSVPGYDYHINQLKTVKLTILINLTFVLQQLDFPWSITVGKKRNISLYKITTSIAIITQYYSNNFVYCTCNK